jgi:hypothetical protein
MLVAVGCVAASLVRLRRVRAATAFDAAALSGALGRNADGARLAALRDVLLAEGSSWEGELVEAALSARNAAERAALVNERLGDVASDLGWGSRIPVDAARLSAMGALCILFVGLGMRGVVGLADIVSIIGWGGAGVLGALTAGREADRIAAEARRAVDTWVTRVLDAAENGEGRSLDHRPGSV